MLSDFHRDSSIDEGDRACYLDDPHAVNVPSKVHPVGIYYISGVDSNGILWYFVWDWHAEGDDSTRPETMLETVEKFANELLACYQREHLSFSSCLYFDARFASIAAFRKLQTKGINSVQVFKGHNAPASLWEVAGRGLEKYEFRVTFLNELHINAITIKTGKKKVRTLLSDSKGSQLVQRSIERRKYPHRSIPAKIPEILEDANTHAHHSDTFNRELLRLDRHSHHSHFLHIDEVVYDVFLHVGVVQSFNTGRLLYGYTGTHLQVLESIIEALAESLGLRYRCYKETKMVEKSECWPKAYDGPFHRCAYSECPSHACYVCKGCGVMMCRHHMLDNHGP